MIEINEGRTNNYLVHGIGVLFLSSIFMTLGYFFWYFLIPAGLFFVVSVLLFSASNGLEFNISTGQYRQYGKILNWKFGQWTTISTPRTVELKMYAANEYKANLINMHTTRAMGTGPDLNTKSLTYDIIINTDSKKHLIYSFIDYKIGKLALQEIGKGYKIPVYNRIQESMQKKRRR